MRRLLVCPHELHHFSLGEKGSDCDSWVLSLFSCFFLRPAAWLKPLLIHLGGSSCLLRNTGTFTRGLIPPSESRSRLPSKPRSRALTTTFASMANLPPVGRASRSMSGRMAGCASQFLQVFWFAKPGSTASSFLSFPASAAKRGASHPSRHRP